MHVSPGHPITEIPIWLVDTWRAIVWVACVVVLVRMVVMANQRLQVSRALIIGRLALAMFIISDMILNAERFHQPLTWEGLPFTTVGVALALWASFADDTPKINSPGVPDG